MPQGPGFFLVCVNPSQLFCCLLNVRIPVISETPTQSCSSCGGILAQMLLYYLQMPRERIHSFVVDAAEHLVDPKS